MKNARTSRALKCWRDARESNPPPRDLESPALPMSYRPLHLFYQDGLAHWHRRNAVLWRAVDEAVGVRQIRQHVAFGVNHAHHAQGFEKDRRLLGENFFLPAHGLLERNVADLTASDGRIGFVFCKTQRARDAAGLGARNVAANSLNFRVIEYFHHNLVVGAHQLERCINRADVFGVCQGHKARNRQSQHG